MPSIKEHRLLQRLRLTHLLLLRQTLRQTLRQILRQILLLRRPEQKQVYLLHPTNGAPLTWSPESFESEPERSDDQLTLELMPFTPPDHSILIKCSIVREFFSK